MNSVLMVVEVICNDMRMFPLHILAVVGYCIGYAILNFTYVKITHDKVYDFLSWEDSYSYVVTVIVITAGVAMSGLGYLAIYLKRCCSGLNPADEGDVVVKKTWDAMAVESSKAGKSV